MLARYQVPELSLLLTELLDLRAQYDKLKGQSGTTKSDEHEQWADYIQELAQTFSKTTYPHAHEILLGACIYFSKTIYYGYYIKSNVRNSALFSLLDDHLKNKDDGKRPRDVKTDFICINYFLEYINYQLSSLRDQSDSHCKKECMLKSIATQVEALAIKLKQEKIDIDHTLEWHIQKLLRRQTNETYFMKKCADLPQTYNDTYSKASWLRQWLRSSDRDQAVKVIESLIAEKNGKFSLDVNKEKGLDYLNLYGFLISKMIEIEKNYKYTKPENSAFYRLCQQATNIRRTYDLQNEHDFLIQDMSILSAHLASVVRSTERVKNWEQHGIHIDSVRHIRDDVIEQMSELNKAKRGEISDSRRNTILQRFGRSVFNGVLEVGVGFGIARLLAGIITSGIGAGVIITALPQFAFMFLGLLWAQKTFRSKLVDMMTSAVTPVASSAVATIAQVPLAPLTRYAVGQTLFGRANADELAMEDIILLRVLSRAPSPIFSQEDKDKLKAVLDLDAEEQKIDRQYEQIGVQMDENFSAAIASASV